MFERFTPRARHAVVLAQEEARQLNHNYIGTEHLLLGLLREGHGVAARALGELGVTHTDVRDDVVLTIGRGDTEVTAGHIPFTPGAKKVLELALRESTKLGHDHIGTEHILLGALREGEGVAATILARHGADAQRVREQVTRLLRDAPTIESESEVPGIISWHTHATMVVGAAFTTAAAAAGRDPLASHHLLIAALKDPQNAATKALLAADVDVDALVAALEHASVEGTSDELPEERARRHVTLAVDDDAVVVRVTDPALVTLARTAWEQRGITEAELRGDAPIGVPLSGVWSAIRDALATLAHVPSESPTRPIRGRSDTRRGRAPKRSR